MLSFERDRLTETCARSVENTGSGLWRDGGEYQGLKSKPSRYDRLPSRIDLFLTALDPFYSFRMCADRDGASLTTATIVTLEIGASVLASRL